MKNQNKPKIIFFGSDSFSVPILEKLILNNFNILLVITKSNKAAGRGRKEMANPLKNFSQSKKLPIKETDKLTNNEIAEIESKNAGIYVVAAFGLIIPEKLLVSPKGVQTINVHPSLLPKYRGASPIEAVILNGDKTTGTTIMVMEKKLDTGPIISQEKIEIDEDEDFITLSEKLAALSAELLEKSLIPFCQGEIKPQVQDNKKASYTKEIKKEDGKIDFTQDAATIIRQTKAFVHWPGSFAKWKEKNKQIKIINASVCKELPSPPYAAGIVFATPEGRPAIVCGQGAVQINTLQLEGKKPTDSKEFLNGYPDFIGSTLN